MPGYWPLLARAAWIVVAVLTVVYYFGTLPLEFARLQTVCTHAGCLLTPTNARELGELGLSVNFFAAYFIAVDIIFTLVWFAVGAVIFWRRSNDRMAFFVALFLVTYGGIGFSGGIDTTFPVWQAVSAFLLFFGNTSSFLFFYLFPDGRFVPRWTRWLSVVITVIALCLFFFPDTSLSNWLNSFRFVEFIGILATGVVAQFYRYWRVSGPMQRQQTKWVVFGLTTAVVGTLGMDIAEQVLSPSHVIFFLVGNTIILLCQILIPLTIGIAILRYRLWEINVLINRTLVYGMLTVCVVGLYVLVVGSFGALFQTRGNLFISLVATGLVAVLTRLGQRLEVTLAPEAVLPTIVETIAQALKLPYTAITMKQEEAFIIAASYGQCGDDLIGLPLIYQTEQVGELVLAPRVSGETFSASDKRLLNDLTHEVGIAVHAVRLTADLQRLTHDLQRSRERLVLTREEERRRLRRDLHDGIGPTLASLSQRLDTARHLVPSDPDAAVLLLEALKGQVKATIADIRRVVYALRPPVLDELGLISALREHIVYAQESNGLRIAIEAPEEMPPLPAAVEVAAYRIILEALTNVERHAHAHTCQVRLDWASAGALCLAITDDGRGLSPHFTAGVGMTSMRERAAELGGECKITSAPTGGTRVWVRLPLSKE
jgi:signal transduction histidine kinase